MLTFHNDAKIKEKYIKRIKKHMKADAIIQGTGWNGTKGCAVGCTLENYNHKQYEVELGIPEWLARLEDRVFEGLPLEEAKKWPLKFLEAVPVGVNLDDLHHHLSIQRLTRLLKQQQKNTYANIKDVLNAIELTIQYHKLALKKDENAAESAAWSAAAESAAWTAEAKDILKCLKN